MEILGFFGGVLYFYTGSWLALLCLLIFIWFRPSRQLCGACCLGYALGMGHQWWLRDQGMPQQAVIRHAVLTGMVATIPKQNPDKTQFEFDLLTLNEHPVHARVQLGCYRDCPIIHAGQYWSLRAKLHTVHNLQNPGGFDYKTYLAARHIHWVGAIQTGGMKLITKNPSSWSMVVIREKLAMHLAHLFPDPTSLGIVQALTIGVTTHISQDSWTLFRCTGTTHLMVISGAHIGLISGMVFKLICGFWSRCSRLCLRIPSHKIASIVAILFSVGYAVVAGFGAPAERATISAGFVFLRYLGQRQFGAWQAWRYALFAVILTEPHAVLLPGFYLSFMAVAVLLTMNRRIHSHKMIKAIAIQMSCMLGLLPFTLYWFAYGAVSGLFANMLAIPWVSFVIVPLAFICLGVGQYLTWLPTLLHLSIHYLLVFLHWVEGLAWMNFQIAYPNLLIAVAGILSLIIFLFLRVRALLPTALTLMIVAIYPMRPHIPDQTFQAQILDVGQGLSVLIQTHNHVLIYDTGGQNFQGSDMGKMVILPYFQHIGLRHLDKIVISHPDLDHRGGLASLETAFPQAELIVDDPKFYQRGVSCHHYPDWIWEGVTFHFFPMQQSGSKTNNRSCVLKVSNESGQLLLTGDIEKAAEYALIQQYGSQLQSTVLVVPHHGSNTSSSSAFLQMVTPKYALFSYGFDNRYHFPHAKALRRYRDLHIPIVATADQGMISLAFKRKKWVIS